MLARETMQLFGVGKMEMELIEIVVLFSRLSWKVLQNT